MVAVSTTSVAKNIAVQGKSTMDVSKPKKEKAAPKEPKAKKIAAVKKPKSSPSHPSFLLMITEAIISLKERTGSSQYAITKFIEEKHKHLPPTFRKLLLFNLKKLVAAGKLVKVKNSFKLPAGSASTKSASATASVPSKKPSKPSAPISGKPAKVKAVVKPRPVAKPKPKGAAKPQAKASIAKPKADAKPKPKSTGRTKAAKTAMKAPGKKPTAAAKPLKAKKATAKSPKKPKSVPTPAKRARGGR